MYRLSLVCTRMVAVLMTDNESKQFEFTFGEYIKVGGKPNLENTITVITNDCDEFKVGEHYYLEIGVK